MVFKQIWENDVKEIVICKINEYFITFTEHVHWIKAAYYILMALILQKNKKHILKLLVLLCYKSTSTIFICQRNVVIKSAITVLCLQYSVSSAWTNFKIINLKMKSFHISSLTFDKYSFKGYTYY